MKFEIEAGLKGWGSINGIGEAEFTLDFSALKKPYQISLSNILFTSAERDGLIELFKDFDPIKKIKITIETTDETIEGYLCLTEKRKHNKKSGLHSRWINSKKCCQDFIKNFRK